MQAKKKDAIIRRQRRRAMHLLDLVRARQMGQGQSLSKTLKFLPTVKAYMSKTEELDSTYYFHGPARYWGAYYAALPSFAGQDLDKSSSTSPQHP